MRKSKAYRAQFAMVEGISAFRLVKNKDDRVPFRPSIERGGAIACMSWWRKSVAVRVGNI
eukprot:1381778-Amorphochlora_amoeboformis.AAC.1